jgi:hypothetical protein
MTVAWILRRARRQSASQRRALWAAATSFLVLGLVSGATVLGLRATRGWMNTVGQSVHVIAFLRDEMEPDQVVQLTDLLRGGRAWLACAWLSRPKLSRGCGMRHGRRRVQARG